MARATITSVSYPFEEPIRQACAYAHRRMMFSMDHSYAVYVAPSLDGVNPRIWIGPEGMAPSEDFRMVLRSVFAGYLTEECNYNRIKERLRTVPIYATSFTDSVGYRTIEAIRELA